MGETMADRRSLPLAGKPDHSQDETPWVVRRPAVPDTLDISDIRLDDGSIIIETKNKGVFHAGVDASTLLEKVEAGIDVTVDVDIPGHGTLYIDGNALAAPLINPGGDDA